MDILKVPAQISKVMTMADGGLRLSVDTQELTQEDKGLVMGMHNQQGWFVFAPQARKIDEEDISGLPEITLEDGEKKPSERLRAALFVYWEQNKIQDPFDIFYRRQMEKFIGTVKSKLN